MGGGSSHPDSGLTRREQVPGEGCAGRQNYTGQLRVLGVRAGQRRYSKSKKYYLWCLHEWCYLEVVHVMTNLCCSCKRLYGVSKAFVQRTWPVATRTAWRRGQNVADRPTYKDQRSAVADCRLCFAEPDKKSQALRKQTSQQIAISETKHANQQMHKHKLLYSFY